MNGYLLLEKNKIIVSKQQKNSALSSKRRSLYEKYNLIILHCLFDILNEGANANFAITEVEFANC